VRILLCGKNAAAVGALEHLVEARDEVRTIGVHGDDGRDGWQPSLKAAAQRLGVPFEQPRRINAPEQIERLARFDADVLVSIQYDQILRPPLFEALGHECLNLHFALLPHHRGVSPIAWAILEGDAEAGVTLHHMVPAIDAGDVVARRAVPIGPETTARELYDAVAAETVKLFVASHPFDASLLGTRLPQDASEASYHRAGDFDFSAVRVPWSRPAAWLGCWLRALIFPPFQHPETRLGGRRLEIHRINGTPADAAREPPGTVVDVSPTGAQVTAGDRTLRVLEVVDPDDPTFDVTRLRPGDRLT
jgi:methionyl-tRNA formyltransferase